MNTTLAKNIFDRLKSKSQNISNQLNHEDFDLILQELDTYEAELLAQNKELIEKERVLQNIQLEYSTIFNKAINPYIFISNSHHIEHYNTSADINFQLSRKILFTKMITSFIYTKDIKKFVAWIKNHNEHFVILRFNTNKGVKRFKLEKYEHPTNEKLTILSFLNIENEYHLIDQLHFSESAFSEILNNLNSSILLIDEEFNIIKSTSNIENFIDLKDFQFHNLIVKQNDTLNLNLINDIKNIIENKYNNIETDLLINDKIFWYSVKKFIHQDKLIENQKNGVLISFVDKTEMITKNKILFQQSKMASMGEMLAAIAHQWRQPLNILGSQLLNLQISKEYSILSEKKIDTYIESSTKILETMSQTIDDFRNFHILDKTKESFFIMKSIKDLIYLFNLIETNISINIDDSKDFEINNFKNHFLQVILILINNSKDAIKSRKIKNGEISISLNEDEKNIKIFIKDNAGGISLEHIDKIFQPYFTTKFKNDGTGIGLYMAKTILETNLNGIISIENFKNGILNKISLAK